MRRGEGASARRRAAVHPTPGSHRGVLAWPTAVCCRYVARPFAALPARLVRVEAWSEASFFVVLDVGLIVMGSVGAESGLNSADASVPVHLMFGRTLLSSWGGSRRGCARRRTPRAGGWRARPTCCRCARLCVRALVCALAPPAWPSIRLPCRMWMLETGEFLACLV